VRALVVGVANVWNFPSGKSVGYYRGGQSAKVPAIIGTQIMKITALIFAAAISSVGSFVLADSHSMEAMAEGSLKPFMAPMDAMMSNMPMASTGTPDADFLMMMIPHHQSAIDMAKVELEIGADDKTKEMAQAVIDAQTAEIKEMRSMLKAMGVEPPAE